MAILVALGTGSIAPAAAAARTLLPTYASLTFKVSSASDWATVSLIGGRVVDARVTSATSNAATSIGTDGIGVGDRDPSSREGADSLPPAQVAVNLVYALPPGGHLEFQICKGDLGTVSAALTRNQGQDHTQLLSLADPDWGLGPGVDGCTNERSGQLGQPALSGPSRWPPPVDPHHRVLAVYYPWYDSTTFESGLWAETAHRPFDTSDRASIGAQIDEARAHNVGGFVVSYNGNQSYARRLSMVTQAAALRPGFSVAPMLEMNELVNGSLPTSLVSRIDRAIEDAMARTTGPNQLQVAGRPVVFIFAAQDLSPAVWSAIRLGLRQTPFFIADTQSSGYGFAGLFNYTSNFAADDQIGGLDQSYEKLARWDPAVSGTGSQRLWVAPVSPGENSCVSNPPEDRVYVNRERGARYGYAWQAAFGSEPEWVLVSTWNEWFEDTAVAPASLNGRRALRQTGTFAQRFETNPWILPGLTHRPPGSANTSRSCP